MAILINIIVLYLILGVLLTWLVEYRFAVVSESEYPIAVILYGVFCWGYEFWRLITHKDNEDDKDDSDQEKEDKTGA